MQRLATAGVALLTVVLLASCSAGTANTGRASTPTSVATASSSTTHSPPSPTAPELDPGGGNPESASPSSSSPPEQGNGGYNSGPSDAKIDHGSESNQVTYVLNGTGKPHVTFVGWVDRRPERIAETVTLPWAVTVRTVGSTYDEPAQHFGFGVAFEPNEAQNVECEIHLGGPGGQTLIASRLTPVTAATSCQASR